MATESTLPGVYIEEDATPSISVSQGATAVPLFIASFQPTDPASAGKIIRVSSWLDFSKKFVAVTANTAKVTVESTAPAPPPAKEDSKTRKRANNTRSITGPDNFTYNIADTQVVIPGELLALQLYFQNGGGACYICALADAANATQLEDLIGEAQDITLLVCPSPDADYREAVYTALLSSLDKNKGYFLLADAVYTGGKVQAPDGIGASPHIAVYYPSLVVSEKPTIAEKDIAVEGYEDAAGSVVTNLAELRSIFPDLAEAIWAKVASADALKSYVSVSPSAPVAGIYCKTDLERGVWKAPANAVINGVVDVSTRVTDDEQGTLNDAGINAIRYFSDRGILVWGARTLQNDDSWGSIPVRRLFDAAERDIKKALRPMIFEPNAQPTWKRVQAAVESYLNRLWRDGALAGDRPEEAYFVLIGKDITMTDDDIAQGHMIVQIGMAPVYPAEFIILQFTQNMQK